jgi:drug/metabolite transporter (DMT)-like permease
LFHGTGRNAPIFNYLESSGSANITLYDTSMNGLIAFCILTQLGALPFCMDCEKKLRPYNAVMHSGISYALVAALLFGISTPFAKLLVGDIPPLMLAGLLYCGSGIGLLGWLLVHRLAGATNPEAPLIRADFPWLAGAILAGGIIAPVLLMLGISIIPASSAALLLNLEGVFTALLAWFVFKENFDRRIMLGMAFIIAGGILLSAQEMQTAGIPWGGLLIAAACLCWGIDNNLTRKVSASDPVQIAGIKGMVSATVNITAAIMLGMHFPTIKETALAGTLGLTGYGISLVLFVLALRNLGTARTGAYFSTAPFFGAAVSLLIFHDVSSPLFWLAGSFMSIGVWLHLTEHHEHIHTHEVLSHAHEHVHASPAYS